MAEALPAEVLDLIARHIESMDHLELLLLLARDAERPWKAVDAARAVHADPRRIDRILEELVDRGLAKRANTDGEPSFRYAPATDSLRQAVASLALMYDQRPVTLIRAVYDRPPSALRSLSDAFLIRDEKEEKKDG